MSEHRHWLSIEHGHVESVEVDDHTEHDFYVQRQDKYTEVQVVPLVDVEVRKHGRDGLDYRVEFKDGEPGGGIYSDEPTAEGAERNALAWLAIAEHLREHPPVDEEQVKALSALVDAVEDDLKGHYGEPADGFARALLATGRVKVEP